MRGAIRLRPGLGHIEAAVGREARQQGIQEAEGRRGTAGGDVFHDAAGFPNSKTGLAEDVPDNIRPPNWAGISLFLAHRIVLPEPAGGMPQVADAAAIVTASRTAGA